MRYGACMAVRSETSRKAVLDATLELLADEPPGPLSLQKLSIEGIARQAGVSKMTIYRWWQNKAEIVIEAFIDNHIAQTGIDAKGPAITALKSHLELLTMVYAGPEGRLISQLIAECQYDQTTLDTFKTRFWQGRLEAATELIGRAQAEGAIRTDLSAEEVAEILYAPIYFRLLLQTGKLEVEVTRRHVDAALAGLKAK